MYLATRFLFNQEYLRIAATRSQDLAELCPNPIYVNRAYCWKQDSQVGLQFAGLHRLAVPPQARSSVLNMADVLMKTGQWR